MAERKTSTGHIQKYSTCIESFETFVQGSEHTQWSKVHCGTERQASVHPHVWTLQRGFPQRGFIPSCVHPLHRDSMVQSCVKGGELNWVSKYK